MYVLNIINEKVYIRLLVHRTDLQNNNNVIDLYIFTHNTLISKNIVFDKSSIAK